MPDPIPIFTPGARILFQGDSITDGNRGRSPDPNHIMGHGYQFILAAKFGGSMPERKLTFLNRGVSGNGMALNRSVGRARGWRRRCAIARS